MKRREFMGLVGGAAVAFPPVVRAQQPAARTARIAYLGATSPATLDPRQIEAFKLGLLENGLVEGRNIEVEYLWAEGDQGRLRQLAEQLARRNLDLIVTAGPQAINALRATGTKTPIVFAIVGDAIGNGIVASLSHPEGNITGLSMSNTDLEGKRIEILKEAAPLVTRLLVLHDSSMGPAGLAEAAATARALAMEMDAMEVSSPDGFELVFKAAASKGDNGVATFASPFFNFNRKHLIELASQYRLPSIWEASAYVRDGGLLSYGPSFADMYRRSAGYVAKILNGTKAADLPVEQPIRFELALNLRSAGLLGITIPPTLITRADEVIE
jgi:putative tryptophan/tyrosine transport system substrate-binding protein